MESKRKVKGNVKFYNLDVILSAGYRVSSKQGTEFRIWANNVLQEYLTKGYAKPFASDNVHINHRLQEIYNGSGDVCLFFFIK